MKPFARAPPKLATGASAGSSTSAYSTPTHSRSNLRDASSSPSQPVQHSGSSGSGKRTTTHTSTARYDRDDDAGLPASGSRLKFSTPSASPVPGTPVRKTLNGGGPRHSLPSASHEASLYSTPLQNRSVLRARSTNAPLTSYSPSLLRTNSDPAWLFSPSSIIPFDAEGNKQAGLEADARAEAIRAGRGEGVVSVDGTPVNPRKTLFGGRKRIIRKRGYWDRISSFPMELIDRYTPDTLTPSPSYAPLLSLLLHLIHFLVRAPLRQSYKSTLFPAAGGGGGMPGLGGPILPVDQREEGRRSRWEKGGAGMGVGRAGKGFGAAIGSWAIFLTLLGLSVANAVYVFQSKRTYHMRLRGGRPIDSPNAKSVPDPASTPFDAATSSSALSKTWAFARTYLSPMPVFRLALGKDMFSTEPAGRGDGRAIVQSLEIWDPPAFNLRFFSSYSPLIPLLFQLIVPTHWFNAILLNILLHFQTQYLVEQYQQLVKDKQILQAEVMREYDEVFVNKKVFSARVDAGVQTDYVFGLL